VNSREILPDLVLLMDLFLVNQSRAGIGYCSGALKEQGLFASGGFIHDDQPEEEDAAILEEDAEDLNNFIIPGGVCHNWVTVGVLSYGELDFFVVLIAMSRLARVATDFSFIQ